MSEREEREGGEKCNGHFFLFSFMPVHGGLIKIDLLR